MHGSRIQRSIITKALIPVCGSGIVECMGYVYNGALLPKH